MPRERVKPSGSKKHGGNVGGSTAGAVVLAAAAGSMGATNRHSSKKYPEPSPSSFSKARKAARWAAVGVALVNAMVLWQLRSSGGANLQSVAAFFAGRPFERAAMLWFTGCVLGSCEAATRIHEGNRLRSLYATLFIASLLGLVQPMTWPTLGSAAGPIALVARALPAFVNIVDFASLVLSALALGTYNVPGRPRAWRGVLNGRLPARYAIALLLCAATLAPSYWYMGRFLVILAAIDELRRASQNPLELCADEAQELNRGVVIWSLVTTVEGLCVASAAGMWTHVFGAGGFFRALPALASMGVGFLVPPAMTLLTSARGWREGLEAISEVRKAPVWTFRQWFAWRRLGVLSLEELELLYLRHVNLLGNHECENNGYKVVRGLREKYHTFKLPLPKVLFFRLKARLLSAESIMPRLPISEVGPQVEAQVRLLTPTDAVTAANDALAKGSVKSVVAE